MPDHYGLAAASTVSLATPDAAANKTLVPLGIFSAVLLFVTVGQRFAVPGAGSRLGIGFVFAYAAFLFGFMNGVLRISPIRVLLYLAMASTLLALIFTLTVPFSPLSIAMLLILYLPFVAVAPMRRQDYERILMAYQGIMTFCAFCGILQFIVQFILGSQAMFPFDKILPDSFFQPNFNLMIPVTASSSLLKSTGLWFLEPSHFSQFLGISLIIEFLYFRRAQRIAIFGVAYIMSFSGTGFILVACTFIFYAIRNGKFMLLLAAAIGVAIVGICFHSVPPFSLFFNRLAEFSNGQTSGSMRFLAPYHFVNDIIAKDKWLLILGVGPGSIDQISTVLDYKLQDSSWLKLFYEYGAVGSIAFMIFYVYSIFWRSPNIVLSWACLIQFMLLGGYLNSFYVQFLHLALIGWPRIDNLPEQFRWDQTMVNNSEQWSSR